MKNAQELIEELMKGSLGFSEAERKSMPPFMKRCTVSVMDKGHDLPAAIAICTKTMQKAGYIKPGEDQRDVTAKGKSASKRHAAQKGHSTKTAEYERRVKDARKMEMEESLLDLLDKLQQDLA